MKRNKEYWLELGSECDDIVWRKKPHPGNAIHVIEYAEYQKLKTQNEIMRVALEFYSEAKNLVATFKDGKHDKRVVDDGRKARMALEVIK